MPTISDVSQNTSGSAPIDLDPMSPEESREYDRVCREGVARRVAKQEAKWRARRAVFSWVEREPDWMIARDLPEAARFWRGPLVHVVGFTGSL